MTKKQDYIPDLTLERYLLQELDPQTAAYINARLEKDKDLKDRLEELKKSNQEILKRYIPELMAAQIYEKYRKAGIKPVTRKRTRRFSFYPLIGWVGVAAAAFLFILIFPGVYSYFQNSDNQVIGEYTGINGDARINIYRKNGDGVEMLFNNAVVYEHDLLRISYSASNYKYGIIFSIDGRSTVTLHYPPNTRAGTQLQGKGEVYLDDAYELDDAPLFERFFFVTSEKEVDVAFILKLARQLAANPLSALEKELPLRKGLHQSSVILRKEIR